MQMLISNKYYGVSENIEIAKGKYAIPFKIGKAIEKGKRQGLMNNKIKNG